MGERHDAPQRLLVLGAGPSQLGLLRTARERGLYVVACDRDPAAVAFEHADRRALVSVEDELGIERIARAERVDGVVAPGVDWPVAIAARVASHLGLPHPLDPDTAAASVSKLRQRRAFEEAGVPQPRWELAKAQGRLTIEPPCVVKPPDRQGQRGVSLVRSGDELETAFARALGESRSGTVLVEEYVDGPEVTVNAFTSRGKFHALSVTDRLTADPPAFGVALAHAWPSRCDHRATVAAAERAVEALGIRCGPSYTQLRIGVEGPRVVEVAARLGGGQDADLCRVALGVDLNALAIEAAFGREPTIALGTAADGACVRFLVPPEGTLLAVEGLEDASMQPGVVDIGIYRRPGHVFGPLRRGSDRAGYILAVGGSREDALARAAQAEERIRFETADAEAELHT